MSLDRTINDQLHRYCKAEHLRFTSSRASKKNGNARVEQKNRTVVRHLVGYGGYATQAQVDQLNAIYAMARLFINFFKLVMRLKSKRWVGSKIKKIYDDPRTPCQRLLDCKVLSRGQTESPVCEFEPVQSKSRGGSAVGGVETELSFHRQSFARQRANLDDTYP